MRKVVDPAAADRLARVCGMLGSAHDGERAAAGLKADQLVRDLGLTWHDVIVPQEIVSPPLTTPQSDWRRMAEFCWSRRSQLTERDRSFIQTMVRWRGEPSEKQAAWILDVFARLHEGGDR